MATNANVIGGYPLPSGIRLHRDGLQVRIYPFPARNFRVEELPEAIRHRALLLGLRDRDIRELPAVEAADAKVSVIAAGYERYEVARMTAAGLSPASFKKLAYKLRPWLGNVVVPDALGRPLHERPLSTLTAGDASDFVVKRAVEVGGTTARDELAGLRSVCRYGRQHGVTVDPRIFDEVRAPAIVTREGIALSWLEAEFLAAFAEEYAVRLYLLLSTLGLRIMEALTATDDWLDGDTLTVPAWACKERREKAIPLTLEEQGWLTEQQRVRVVRLRGPRVIFPRLRGSAFTSEAGFHSTVWAPTLRRALRGYVAEHRVEPRWASWARDEKGEVIRNRREGGMKLGPPRVEGLEPHDLRRTAISLMREAGMPEEHVAARVGHIDEGQQKTYRKLRPDEQRRVLRGLGAGLGAHLTTLHEADAEAGKADRA